MVKHKISVHTKDRGVLNIKIVPNQKVVEIRKVNPKGKGILDIAANKEAMQTLSANGYVLYMHFVLNVPGYLEALSSKYIIENTTLSERGYYKSVEELIEKQYLVREQNPNFRDYFVFYEDPKLRPTPDEKGSDSDSSLDEI